MGLAERAIVPELQETKLPSKETGLAWRTALKPCGFWIVSPAIA